jgi:glycosyltransferase involved in cell wall biosynthesis
MAAVPILFVDHAPALGGAEINLLRFLDELDREKFAPHLATLPGQLADAARARNAAVHIVPLQRLRGQAVAGWTWARGTAALARIIRQHRIHLVLSNSMRASFYAAGAARLTGRPFIWHVQDIFPPGLYVRAMRRLATVIVAISHAIAAPLGPSSKLHVVYPGVRGDAVARQGDTARREWRARWAIPHEAMVVGQIARLQPWKGQRDVIAAVAPLLPQYPNLYLAIIGGNIFGDAPAYEAELRARVQALGLSNRIVLTGHVDDVPEALAGVDVVVHASDREPFGLILIEAGAAGRPVVAYDSGAAAEILRHEHTGLLVASGDATALREALRRVIEQPEWAQRLGTAAARHVREHFEATRMARALEAIFTAALAASARGARQ